jgi:hypothetical protein
MLLVKARCYSVMRLSPITGHQVRAKPQRQDGCPETLSSATTFVPDSTCRRNAVFTPHKWMFCDGLTGYEADLVGLNGPCDLGGQLFSGGIAAEDSRRFLKLDITFIRVRRKPVEQRNCVGLVTLFRPELVESAEAPNPGGLAVRGRCRRRALGSAAGAEETARPEAPGVAVRENDHGANHR